MAQRIFVDTDLGVDDAAAIAWLAMQADDVDIVGVATVWGNTTVESATRNAAGLLDTLGLRDVPIVAGAGRPLEREHRSRIGDLVHGDDGLWGAAAGADASRAADDVVAAYRTLPSDGATLLALGPLTNLALVLRAAPDALRRFERIVILGGAKHHGSMTPVSETNFWHDPEAAEEVLAARLPITLVTRDAHRAFVLSKADIAELGRATSPAARLLAKPMEAYARVTGAFGEAINFPDIVAAVVAVDPSVATQAHPALIRVIAGGEAGHPLTRGQSIIGVSLNERLTMVGAGAAMNGAIEAILADRTADLRPVLAGLLEREPPNARVVLAVDADAVRSRFMHELLKEGP